MLNVGSQIGPYQVTGLLGSGGMGEVYRARDTKLNRDVAIKVLPDAVSRDPERLARFDREAQVVASVNHTNIAAIYELEDADGIRCLVLEYVDGETLAERIRRGPIPLDETLQIAKQIAEALEAAHEKGITHRDLKPANIKVTPEGKVKVLDFGLAKILETTQTDVNLSNSPTLSVGRTAGGVILGTAGYMSPEQARGKPVDKRTDIWAFGCVVFEMLSGRQTFEGETISDSVARILEREPDWSLLPANTPARLQDLLRRCLYKDSRRRAHDIADVRIELEELLSNPNLRKAAEVSKFAFPRSAILLSFAIGVVLSGVGTLVFWNLLRPAASSRQTSARMAIRLGTERMQPGDFLMVAASPDGNRIVYAATQGEISRLFIRPIDQFNARPIDGTDNALSPFFSPDGQWVGFFAGGKLKKVAVTGGSPITISDTTGLSGTWGANNTIAFTPDYDSGLMTVSADGGKPQRLTTPDAEKREVSHRWPQFLPGGTAILFTVKLNDIESFDDAQIAVQVIGEPQPRLLLRGGTFARYLPSGHIVYARGGTLLAVPFDLNRLQVTGPPTTVLEDVATVFGSGAAHYALSEAGMVIYIPGGILRFRQLPVLVDRSGTVRPLMDEPAALFDPAFAPDGRRIALTSVLANNDVLVLDVEQKKTNRFTFGGGNNGTPVWTPDGKRLLFGWGRSRVVNVFWKDANDGGEPESLLTGENAQWPSSVSPDGKTLAFTEAHPQTLRDIWLLPLQGERKPQRFAVTQFDEWGAKFSPNGRWIAYTSNESRRDEIYVQGVQGGTGGKHQVSSDGGIWPVWSPDGRELFFLNGNNLMAAKVDPDSGVSSQAAGLLTVDKFFQHREYKTYDIAPDGRSFLMIQRDERPSATHINVIFNWLEELKQRVPVK